MEFSIQILPPPPLPCILCIFYEKNILFYEKTYRNRVDPSLRSYTFYISPGNADSENVIDYHSSFQSDCTICKIVRGWKNAIQYSRRKPSIDEMVKLI